ncbi:MAG: glutamate--cysteine ligase [bacterium]
MGIEVDRTAFEPNDYQEFQRRLEDNLLVLRELLAYPDFGDGPASMGAELEMYIVDGEGKPRHLNTEIAAAADDPQLTLELNRYNLEYNLTPYLISENAFAATEAEIVGQQAVLSRLAESLGGRVVAIGILPTLSEADFTEDCITPRKRYFALREQLLKRRGSRFRIDINGDNPLKMEMEDITLEGANTSFQIHYRVNPADYIDTYNAFQLMTPLAVALGANSPGLFGHSLWAETRIPLFKQSIDTRIVDRYGWNQPARVSFGRGWARREPIELFTEVVRSFETLLPLSSSNDCRDQMRRGITPTLDELRLHLGSVWPWNRPVYDDADGGMLRIESRALPAGPTASDMVANAAFLIGLVEGIRPQINELLSAISFGMADYNFYRAAQYGLQARLVWPELNQYGNRDQRIVEIIETMLPVASRGLAAVGVSDDEIKRYLTLIERRLANGQTGAVWQSLMIAKLRDRYPEHQVMQNMLADYMAQSAENLPVSEWEL